MQMPLRTSYKTLFFASGRNLAKKSRATSDPGFSESAVTVHSITDARGDVSKL
jgi:hypothetical protein